LLNELRFISSVLQTLQAEADQVAKAAAIAQTNRKVPQATAQKTTDKEAKRYKKAKKTEAKIITLCKRQKEIYDAKQRAKRWAEECQKSQEGAKKKQQEFVTRQ